MCALPGCGRPTLQAEGRGLSPFHCGYHVKLKARHGSFLCRTIRGPDLKPYTTAATAWLKVNAMDPEVATAVADIAWSMPHPREAIRADEVRGKLPKEKVRVALARLRKAGIPPERLVAIHMAVTALITEDADADRSDEYRLVQVGKAAHRLASGTHRDGVQGRHALGPRGPHAIRRDIYPQSSGRVLRFLGSTIEAACGHLTAKHLPAIIALKTERFGPHPSHLPGWVPRWKREFLAAQF